LSSLPTLVTGNSAASSSRSGYLNFATPAAARTSLIASRVTSWPGCGTTKTQIRSPSSGSAAATAAAWAIPGILYGDLDGLGRDYVELVAAYEKLPVGPELAALDGPEALRRQIEPVASYRALPFRDPDLPAALLPEGWPGRHAHALFTATHDALHGPADAFVRSVVHS
jgi:hypothetical protein